MNCILRFAGTMERDSTIDAWLKQQPAELGEIARKWFAEFRDCGDDVRELIHDGCPVACAYLSPAFLKAETLSMNFRC